ncbi:MAG TPA: hypothetical protein VHT71_11265 [Methylomirabilota bacterium]|jgi:tetratricopeptide (TPR) repeat protein|nr:hypothetical protein [Methylomirabilota bacterium]
MQILRTVLVLTLVVVPALVLSAQDRPEKLGTVHFPVSCASGTQPLFDRAVALLHSFHYPETLKAFQAVIALDPSCAMAYWGLAIAQRPNPIVGPFDAATLRRGAEALEKARATGPKTARERDFIAALETFFRDPDKPDHQARVLAYERAMEGVSARHPQDAEAAIFYALALNEAVDPLDTTFARQLKAGAILEKVLATQPDHPGVAHYIIHSYDFPPLATRGLPAARQYAALAPSAPHALHMPSHIFSMVGSWHEAIAADTAAVAAYRDYAARNNLGGAVVGELHSLDFLTYAYLQTAQDREARRVVDERNAIQKFAPPFRVTGDTAFAAVPVRYVLERGRWNEAAALELRPTQYPQAEAVTRFGRGLGLARTGDLAGARREIDALQGLRDTLAQGKQIYWAEQVDVQRRAVAAWVARAEGQSAEAVTLLRSAADLEDRSAKHVAMENRLFPMRELLGDLLLELGEPVQALAEFEASLKNAPNRFRSFHGAALAAQRTGDLARARAHYERLVALAARGDSERPELSQARAFLAALAPR